MFDVRLLAKAEEEFADAVKWYEARQAGLGKRFISEVDKCLSVLQDNPFLFAQKLPAALRCAPVRVFPYMIIYWIHETDNAVFVVSVFHMKRKSIG
ncbi:MAG: type II toxin-antitoxin system RelE/ParE family toxin [Mucilaginibacter polytrichastri]|nr:type II toxin-antitoxin system RelE/ParE family toxin [Mucilaginibacter polytrichastri]